VIITRHKLDTLGEMSASSSPRLRAGSDAYPEVFHKRRNMQIACKRYDCQKAVEVCYWSCKFRKICKDWEGALVETPGADAVRVRLEASAKKSGRAFDPKLLVVPARKKKAA